MTSSNPGGTAPPGPTFPNPSPTPAPGTNLGVGTAPAQASFVYGTFGPTVVGGRVTGNGQIIDVPMPTDPNSGDTGFMTGTGGETDSIASDPQGRFVYTLDVQTSTFGIPIGSNGIGAFKVDRATGELARIPGSPYPVSYRGGSVVEDGHGLFLFAAVSKTNVIDTYSIDQSTGALKKTATLKNGAVDQLAAGWDGRFVFNAGNGRVASYSIAAGTGTLTQVSTVSVQNVGPIFLSYSGKFLYSVSNSGVTTISVGNTGQLTVTQASFPAVQVAGGLPRRMIATSRDDRFAYIGTSSGENIGALQTYSVDPTTGAIGNPVGKPVTMQVGQSPLQVTLDFNGSFLYATFTGINLQTFPIQSDGSIGPGAINSGESANVDFFELSP
jgi:6-phosphogluconolactonase (cycloisomerase 2 family)